MTPYIVSARKYRPDTFDTLVGQDNIAQTLKNSIIRGQLAHAYLFCGPRGVGKTTTARIFAKAINCSNPTADMEACGHCESCQSFAEGRSYCIHELDAASNNGVEDIKTLMDQVRIPPQVGKYSVYIIDEVHMLSQAAFNSFLKTLEEPPAHAIFILATTEKHKILPTIMSRCQTYDFNRITVDKIVGQLRNIAGKEGVNIDDESLHVIALKADGALRDALTIFDQTVAFCGTDVKYEDVLKNLNVLDYEYSFSLVNDFLTGNYPDALLTFDEILTKGFNALHFVAALSSHFRDLIVSKSGSLDALLELPASLKKKYMEQAGRCDLGFLYNALAITTACETGYRTSVNPRLHIEFTLMKLCTLTNASPIAQTPAQAPQAAAAGPAQNPQPQPVQQTKSAPQPAPVSEPTVETKPKTTRAAKSAGIPSIDELMKKSRQAEPEKQENMQPAEELSEEVIKEKWQDLAKVYEKTPNLATAIKLSKLEISQDKKVLKFLVSNSAQKDWIQEKRLNNMEEQFRKLTNSDIKLVVDVLKEEETAAKVAFLPSEKAKELIDSNEEVKNLVKDLQLEIK